MRDPERRGEPSADRFERSVWDVGELRALHWFGEQPETAFAHLTYGEVRAALKRIEYDGTLRPAAMRLSEQFHARYGPRVVEKAYMVALERDATAYLKAKAQQVHAEYRSQFATGHPSIIFTGGGQALDIVAIYVAPKLTGRDIHAATDAIVDAMRGLEGGEIKFPTPNWFEPDIPKVPDGGVGRVSPRLNRIVVAFPVERSGEITAFLRRLSGDHRLLTALEDSGEWAKTYRIPLAPGISFVERSARVSWDQTEFPKRVAHAVALLHDPKAPIPRDGFGSRLDPEERQEILRTHSLTPIGRSTLMPGLREP